MAQITKGSQFIAFALYFFSYCSCWGVVQHFPPPLGISFRNARSPNSRGCLSTSLNNRTPTKHLKGKNWQGWAPPEKKGKKKKINKKRRKKKWGGGIPEASSAFFYFLPHWFPPFFFPPDYWLITIRSWLITISDRRSWLQPSFDRWSWSPWSLILFIHDQRSRSWSWFAKRETPGYVWHLPSSYWSVHIKYRCKSTIIMYAYRCTCNPLLVPE